jgi:hypothetical protein
MYSMLKKLFVIFALIGLQVMAYAQSDAVMDMVNSSASKLIDSVMQTINMRADIFNEEVGKVNKLRPLEVENLSKEKVEANIPAIKEFLGYLEVYRVTSDKEKARIQDSVSALRAYLPKSKQKKYLRDFVNAYALDQEAFYKYTLSLTGLYSNVLELLNFMSGAHTEIKDQKIVFTDRTELKQYEKILAKVEKQIQKQSVTSLASQKASFEAGQIMQKSYGKLQ